VKARLQEVGADPIGSTPAELAAHLKAEMDRWAPVIKDARITAE
jgi:tripartite-type tricarboxylate transporter receptor subunit TctC